MYFYIKIVFQILICLFLFKCENEPVNISSDYIESDVLQKIICSHIYEFDVPGFISRDELVKVVKKGNILPKGSLLNKTKMDAENYYIQVGDMNDIAHLYTLLR